MAVSHIALMGQGNNRRGVLTFMAAVIALVGPSCAIAQDIPTPATSPAVADVSQIPALTPVEIVVDADLGSKISITGQTFPLHLASAVVIGGKELVSAGTTGEGEVIHAKKAGGSGAPGELVVAARYLQIGSRRLKLRSMRIGLVGKDAVNAVVAFNAATVATPLPIGIIGFAVTGRNVVYSTGTVATAKTAETFVVTSGEATEGTVLANTGAVEVAPADVSSGKVAGQ